MCIILFNIFIYFSPCFGHSYVHNQEKIAVSMRRWYLSLSMGGVWSAGWVEIAVSFQPAERTPPTQSDKHQCRIDTVIFSWWCAYGYPKRVQKRKKHFKQNCAPSWTYMQDYTGMHGQQNIKYLQPIMQTITVWLGYGGRQKNRDLFSGIGEGIFIFSIASQTGLWVHTAYHQKGIRGFLPWDKAAVTWSLPLASIQCLSWRTSGVTNPLHLYDAMACARTFTEHEMLQNLILELLNISKAQVARA